MVAGTRQPSFSRCRCAVGSNRQDVNPDRATTYDTHTTPSTPTVPLYIYMCRSWIFSNFANGPPGGLSPARSHPEAMETPLEPIVPLEAMLYA